MLDLPAEILNAPRRGVSSSEWLAIISERLDAAQTLADEIHALVSPLPARDQWFMLGTWSYFHQSAPSQQEMIEALPPASRVSRQRVCQIVQRHHSWLAGNNLRPRLLNGAVAVLQHHGGTLPWRRWMDALEREGLNASAGAIRALPILSQLGLVPDVSYNPWSHLWSARAAHDDCDAEDIAWIEELKNTGRAALRLQGAIPRADLESLAIHGLDHALELISPEVDRWHDVEGYLVPEPQHWSRLSQLAKKILSVSAPLDIRWIWRGIARTTRQPIMVPLSVVRSVLERHPDFQVRGKRVRSRKPLSPHQVLSRVELAFLELITSRGGSITAGGVTEWLRNQRVSPGYTAHLCRAPFVRRLDRGLYALVGRQIPYTRRLRASQRGSEQSPIVGSPEWDSESSCVVTYRAESVRASGGLWLPGELAFALSLGPGRWGAILPDDSYVPLQLSNRLLIGLREWTRRMRDGEATLVARFELSTNQVLLSSSADILPTPAEIHRRV